MSKDEFAAAKSSAGKHKEAVDAMATAIASASPQTPEGRLAAAVGAHIASCQALLASGGSADDFFSGLELMHQNKEAIKKALSKGIFQ